MSRPIYVRSLTKSEQTELSRSIRSNQDARVVRRAQMVRLSVQGKKFKYNCKNIFKRITDVFFLFTLRK